MVWHGYGGWCLELNVYGAGEHFDRLCIHCNGWGYLAFPDAHRKCAN